MIRYALLLVSAVFFSSLFAQEKPIQCSMSVTKLKGESKVVKDGGSSGRSGSTSTTTEVCLKWLVKIAFNEQKPSKIELKVHHVGYTDGGKTLTILETETPAVELDAKGRAAIEVSSPKTRLTKTRSRSTGSSGGGGTSKTVTGDRVTDCVVQLFGDGAMLKSWTSSPRFSAAMKKDPFSVDDPKKKSDKNEQK